MGQIATSRLELRWRVRFGGKDRAERHYLDFVVDGQSLTHQFPGSDYVTPLGCWMPDAERTTIEQLLTGSQRLPLYVCAECGELRCGAITALVELRSDAVVWRAFVFENGLDAEVMPAPGEWFRFAGSDPI